MDRGDQNSASLDGPPDSGKGVCRRQALPLQIVQPLAVPGQALQADGKKDHPFGLYEMDEEVHVRSSLQVPELVIQQCDRCQQGNQQQYPERPQGQKEGAGRGGGPLLTTQQAQNLAPPAFSQFSLNRQHEVKR
jgi:hypothetical protein